MITNFEKFLAESEETNIDLIRKIYQDNLEKFGMTERDLTNRGEYIKIVPQNIQNFLHSFRLDLNNAEVFDPRFDDSETVINALSGNEDRILLNALFFIYFRDNKKLIDKFINLDFDHSSIPFIHPKADAFALPLTTVDNGFQTLVNNILIELKTTFKKLNSNFEKYKTKFVNAMDSELNNNNFFQKYGIDVSDFTENSKYIIDKFYNFKNFPNQEYAQFIYYLIFKNVLKVTPSYKAKFQRVRALDF
jgi:hypothetical protein